MKIFHKKVEGDIYTPISIYRSLKGEKKMLLESSLKAEQQGRYSFIAADPYMELFTEDSAVVKREYGSKEERYEEKFLDVVKAIMPDVQIADSPFPFLGGAVGYVGYDMIRQYEEIGSMPADDLKMPDAHLMFYRDVVVYDHLKQQISIVSTGTEREEEAFMQRAESLERQIREGAGRDGDAEKAPRIQFRPGVTQEAFKSRVRAAKEEIAKGEIFQVVLSQRYTTEFTGDALRFYRNLRRHNPSPYMYFIDFHDYQVVGSSPESLVKGNGEQVLTNPIAGTRRRGLTDEEDLHLEKELLQDEKELAEHRMLVDLGRNDLGRVSTIGSVKLTKYMEVDRYSSVMHIVSEVAGRQRPDIRNADVLASCLPAGTVSGAPKIRAMQIINELEKQKRGVYGGAVGYFSIHGSFDFALAIRTMIVKDGRASIQAGAGIVYDSDPDAEYEEVLNKAKALMEVGHDLTYR